MKMLRLSALNNFTANEIPWLVFPLKGCVDLRAIQYGLKYYVTNNSYNPIGYRTRDLLF